MSRNQHQMPPTFNHLDHSDGERMEAFHFWTQRFEAFSEGYYNHKTRPSAEDEEANLDWKRLLRLALDNPTAKLVDSHFPDFRESKDTYCEIMKFLGDRFQDQSSDYQSFNLLLDTYQKNGESFSDFLDRVTNLASRSGFPNREAKDVVARHQALRGTTSQTIRANALQHKWTIQELRVRAKEVETSLSAAGHQSSRPRAAFQSQVDYNTAPSEEEDSNPVMVHRISGPYSKQTRLRGASNQYPQRSRPDCGYCGKPHPPGRQHCSAAQATCTKCSKRGHFSSVCRSSQWRGDLSRATNSSHQVANHEVKKADDSAAVFYNILAIQNSRNNCGAPPAMAAFIRIGSSTFQAIVDTGAQANVLPLRLIGQEERDQIEATTITVRPFGSIEIQPKGNLRIDTTWQNSTLMANWIIIDDAGLARPIDPIISCSLSQALGLATLHNDLVPYNPLFYTQTINKGQDLNQYHAQQQTQLKQERKTCVPEISSETSVYMNMPKFRGCFEGLGCLLDYQVKLHLKPGAKPHVSPPRPQPFYLQGQIDAAIAEMLANGVIEFHHGPTDWVSNLAVAFKEGGTIRITVDLRGLNSELQDTRVPIPTPESIKAKLAGCRFFSKLDFTQSFHQLQLHPSSRNLTVFRSGGKLYRYRRVSMGLKPASGELAQACRNTFGHLEHVHTIHDDVIIAAPTKKQHDIAVVKFLEVVRKCGMTLNPAKCTIGAKEITFWGVRISEWGVSPDRERVRALREARPPKTKQDLVSFLCMARSHQDFIPSIAGLTPNLRALTKKFVQFKWKSEHQREFEALKHALTEDIYLAFFNMDLRTHIIVDAHRDGLGAILAQGETVQSAKPVAMASRSTSPTEKRYPQLDLEALAVDFGLRRFRPYLLGNPNVIVHTDHKPLTSVLRESRLGSIRTDRIKLRHQDIQYQIQHLRGADNPADFLSRNPTPWNQLSEAIKSEADECEKLLYIIHSQDILPSIRPEELTRASDQCTDITALRDHVWKGTQPKKWTTLRPYKAVFGELTVSALGNLLRGERLVVPTALRREVVARAHGSAHLGVVSLKRRLRAGFWFPGMDKMAEEHVAGCEQCQLFVPEGVKTVPKAHRVPPYPWHTVSVDLFGPTPKGKHVVVCRCLSSRYPAATFVPQPSGGHTIKALQAIFAQLGVPRILQTDNAAIFHSGEFQQFAHNNDIEHIFSPPYHPRSNPAECTMKLIGKAIKMSDQTVLGMERAISGALEDYRCTPHPATGLTPLEMMRDRKTMGKIAAATRRDWASKLHRASKYNQPAKNMRLHQGQIVRVKELPRSSKFSPLFSVDKAVVERRIHGDTYRLCYPRTGKIVDRHRDHLKPIPAPSTRITDHNVTEQQRTDPIIIIQPPSREIQCETRQPQVTEPAGVLDDPYESAEEGLAEDWPWDDGLEGEDDGAFHTAPGPLTKELQALRHLLPKDENGQPSFRTFPPHRPHTRSMGPPEQEEASE